MIKDQAMKSLRHLVEVLSNDLDFSRRDVQTLRLRTTTEGYSFLTQTLPLLAKALEEGLRDGVFRLPTNFRRKGPRSALPALLGSRFSAIFEDSGLLRPNPCVVAIYAIRQLCYFFYKTDLPRKQELDNKVIDQFVETEAALKSAHEINRVLWKHDPIIIVARSLIAAITSNYDGIVSPKHGPGAVSNTTAFQKYEAPLSPDLPAYQKYGTSFFFNVDDAFTRLDRHPVRNNHSYFRKGRSCAKVILVPKDSRGPRLISCEPWEHQYLQQGIMRQLISLVESHPLSRGRINFTDQSINRELARVGSLDRSWSTLDLKDASDRNSLALTENLFIGEVLNDLMITRTPETKLPSGEILPLYKFAPMGSAVCFPVMAISLWALIVAYLIGRGLPIEQASSQVYVYGDDIIVPTCFARDIPALLERYSFRVNTKKSFIDSNFLESCGFDAYAGNDVTPVKLRSLFCENSYTPSEALRKIPNQILSLLETGNLLAQSGLRRTSKLLWTWVEKYLGPLPYGHPSSPYLHRHTSMQCLAEMNYVLRRSLWVPKSNRQRYPDGSVMRAWTVKTVSVESPETFYGYLWRSMSSRAPLTWRSRLGIDPEIRASHGHFQSREIKIVKKTFDHFDFVV